MQASHATWLRLPRMLRYACTAGLAAAVDIGGFLVLSTALFVLVPGALAPGLWVVSVGVAAALSFLLAAAVNYRLSAGWVFDHEWKNARRAGRFLVGASLGLAVNAGATTALAVWALWPPLAAKVAGVGLAFGVNFSLNARWVFGQGGQAPGARQGRSGPQAGDAGAGLRRRRTPGRR